LLTRWKALIRVRSMRLGWKVGEWDSMAGGLRRFVSSFSEQKGELSVYYIFRKKPDLCISSDRCPIIFLRLSSLSCSFRPLHTRQVVRILPSRHPNLSYLNSPFTAWHMPAEEHMPDEQHRVAVKRRRKCRIDGLKGQRADELTS
jgi:hypothetical protein